MNPRWNSCKSEVENTAIQQHLPDQGEQAKFFLMLLKGVFLVLQGKILHARLKTLPMLA